MHPLLDTWAGLNFSGLPQQLVNGLLVGGIYALIALGYTMVYGVLRLINFAHGEVYMLGAYVALFVSWQLGYSPEMVAAGKQPAPNPLNLAIMLVFSMVVCAIIGMVIEYVAYRPMRNQSRISALITAIGISLLLQYGGALFLPVAPPPSISETVNPYRGAFTIPLKPAAPNLVKQRDEAHTQVLAIREQMTSQGIREVDFGLPPEKETIRQNYMKASADERDADARVNNDSVSIIIRHGQLIMLIATLVLMAALRWLVMFTPVGRAMRAVSHDFDSASLMGINVNQIITFTFMVGSALAGAGAMMYATLGDSPSINTFYGSMPGVKAFVAAVLGGIGNIPGAVLGGLLMGMAENMVTWLGYSEYKDAVAFVILIGVLMFRPGGLLGSSKVEKV
jgi:branched-chain amino acid transport system permease protein